MPSFSVFSISSAIPILFVLYFHCTTLSTLFFSPEGKKWEFSCWRFWTFSRDSWRWAPSEMRFHWFTSLLKRHESNKWIWLEKAAWAKETFGLCTSHIWTPHLFCLRPSNASLAFMHVVAEHWKKLFGYFGDIFVQTSFVNKPSEVRKFLTNKNFCDHEIWSYIHGKRLGASATGLAATGQHFWYQFEAQRCDGGWKVMHLRVKMMLI